MAFKRTNFKTLTNANKTAQRAKMLNNLAAFLICFEKFYFLLNEGKSAELLKEYAETVNDLKEEFSAEQIVYAQSILKFLNSFKSGKIDIESANALCSNPQEWEKFVIAALAKVHLEYMFDEHELALL